MGTMPARTLYCPPPWPRLLGALLLFGALACGTTETGDSNMALDAIDSLDAVDAGEIEAQGGDVAGPDSQGDIPLHEALPERDLLPYVNPFIGTDGPGNVIPGVLVPHGMVKLSPDSVMDIDDLGGYDYDTTELAGFSHTHLEGPGGSRYGYSQVQLMPVREVDDIPGPARHSSYSHEAESASPGVYEVSLPEAEARVDLAATAHCGITRVHYEGALPRALVLDATHTRGRSLGGHLEVVGDDVLEGFAVAALQPAIQELMKNKVPGTGERTLFFHMQVSQAFTAYATWEGGDVVPERPEVDGPDLGAWLRFDGLGDAGDATVLEARVCISGIDVATARASREAELDGRSFEEIQGAAAAEWNTVLNRIPVDNGAEVEDPSESMGGLDEAQLTAFYTALYHAHFQPTDVSERGRHWIGASGTGEVVETKGAGFYVDDFCMWDTFRTSHPLHILTDPERELDSLNSLLDLADHGGWLPKCTWQAGGYSRIMIANPALPILADAWLKGLEGMADLDIERIYRHMQKTADEGEDPYPVSLCGYFNLGTTEAYIEEGFVSHECDPTQSVSMTLEYAQDDYSMWKMAEALGHADDAERYRERAGYWKNHWNEDYGFMQARHDDGSWVEPFDPALFVDANDFCEASSWIYSWFVPHDVPGMIALMGGAEAVVERLDQYFDEGFHDIGNQPGFHVPYLYAFAGRPDKTQARMRELLTSFNETPNGLPGNDDAGAMSAWYLFGALGFYPVNPGEPRYTLASPIFPRATLRLDPEGHRRFIIEAPGAGVDKPYVQSATLNGLPLEEPWILHEDLIRGGTLRLEMGPEPSNWGR